MQKNMFQNNFNPSCFKMTSFIRLLMLTFLLKMELLRGRIDTSLKLAELYYFICMCPSISRPMLFPELVFLLTGCLHQSSIGTLRITSFSLINLYSLLSLGYLDLPVLFEMFILRYLNLTINLENVSFLVIARFRRGIGVIALIFVGTWFLRMSSFLRMSLYLHPRATLIRGGRRLSSVYYCLPCGPSCSYSSKASYHSSIHSKPEPTSLWSSTDFFDIRSSS